MISFPVRNGDPSVFCTTTATDLSAADRRAVIDRNDIKVPACLLPGTCQPVSEVRPGLTNRHTEAVQFIRGATFTASYHYFLPVLDKDPVQNKQGADIIRALHFYRFLSKPLINQFPL